MRIESRITGIGQKPNVAGKVLVKWDYNGTVGTYICIDHSNLRTLRWANMPTIT